MNVKQEEYSLLFPNQFFPNTADFPPQLGYAVVIDQNHIRQPPPLAVRHFGGNATPCVDAGEAFGHQALELKLFRGVNHQQNVELDGNFPFRQKGGVDDHGGDFSLPGATGFFLQ